MAYIRITKKIINKNEKNNFISNDVPDGFSSKSRRRHVVFDVYRKVKP
jgi:hypothetical protein